MSIQLQNILKRLTNIFNLSSTSVWYQILNGIGEALDQNDPSQIGLAQQFSVTSATGTALDANGADWGIERKYGESDTSYRSRILAELPMYASGPTVNNMKSIVRGFTNNIDPTIFEFGPNGFTMGSSAMGTFGFSVSGEVFNFQVSVNNPNYIEFSKKDLINAINKAKPARSGAEFVFPILAVSTWNTIENLPWTMYQYDRWIQVIQGGIGGQNIWNTIDNLIWNQIGNASWSEVIEG